ncbi:MAG: LD-carboxypeptidase [Gammaproteobacteria bacterium]
MNIINSLPILKLGDSVEIIAPASRCTDQRLKDTMSLLTEWHLNPIISDTLFAPDLLCANTDENRFNNLKKALFNPATKAIIIAKGGYGSIRLLSKLNELQPPKSNKIFVGMSDSISLQIFLQQKWGWPTIHGTLAKDRISFE